MIKIIHEDNRFEDRKVCPSLILYISVHINISSEDYDCLLNRVSQGHKQAQTNKTKKKKNLTGSGVKNNFKNRNKGDNSAVREGSEKKTQKTSLADRKK